MISTVEEYFSALRNSKPFSQNRQFAFSQAVIDKGTKTILR
jgi:hypothetical protein